jgi:hypothetical protein
MSGWPTHADMLRAADGDTTAFEGMMRYALKAAEVQAIPDLEGLVAADFWGRLASAFGGPLPLCMLAEVLLKRSEYERRHGTAERALWHAAEAVRRLNQAADAGEEGAGTRLAEIVGGLDPDALVLARQVSTGEGLAINEGYDCVFRAAATGDVEALGCMIDEAIKAADLPGVEPLETVTLLENVGRLGAATNDPELTRRLAGGMFLRGELDRETDPEAGELREIEALGILASMVERNMPGGREAFTKAEAALEPRTVSRAAKMIPRVLAALSHGGSC